MALLIWNMRRPEDVSGDGGVSDKTGWEGRGQRYDAS
jgi:hypothetical protein